MDTTRMKTRLPQAWIEQVVAGNPAKLLPSGHILLPPARMSFFQGVYKSKDKIENGVTKPGKHGTGILFPFGADVAPQYLAAASVARKDMIRSKYPDNPEGAGFDSPFKDQGVRIKPTEGGTNKMGKSYEGFVPGYLFMEPRANNRPALSELVGGVPTAAVGSDEELAKRFYSGMWAMCTVSVFKSTSTENPNVFFGLEAVLKIADDNRFGGEGGGVAPDYASVGVNITAPVDPAALFQGAGAGML